MTHPTEITDATEINATETTHRSEIPREQPTTGRSELPRAASGDKETTRSRLTPEREAQLFDAVLELLLETGYEALTMDAVAARAHTSKATIYRQWQGKPRLVATALRHLKPAAKEIDTGSLRGDLMAVAKVMGSVADTHGQLIASVSHAVLVDPELALAVRACMLEPNDDRFAVLLSRAVARGEVAPGNPALDHVPVVLLSAMLSRPMLEGRHVDEAYLRGLVEAVVLPALTCGGEASSPDKAPSPEKRKRILS